MPNYRFPTMLTFAALVLMNAALAAAQESATPPQMSPEQQAKMQKWTEYATPGPFHEFLAKRVGTWDYRIVMWCEPNDPPMESTGVLESKMVLGGRYLVDHAVGSDPNQPFEGKGLIGYDNLKKKFVAVWVDTMSTGIMMSEGQCDAAGTTFTYQGQYTDPVSGAMKTCKSVEEITDPDHWTMRMYDVLPDGTEVKMMEITYTRKN